MVKFLNTMLIKRNKILMKYSLKTNSLALVLFLLNILNSFGQSDTQKEIQYLSGTDVKHTKTWNFWVTAGRNSGKWTTIQVPGHWEQQGFGGYNYGRDNVTNGKISITMMKKDFINMNLRCLIHGIIRK